MADVKGYRDILASALDLPNCKIVAAARARLFHTHFGADHKDWSPMKVKGLLVFGRDRHREHGSTSSHSSHMKEGYWFQLIDTNTHRVVWTLSVPEYPEYHLDRPFFHVLAGSSRLWGLLFEEDDEATTFYTKVTTRIHRRFAPPTPPPKAVAAITDAPHVTRISKAMVSAPAPNSFVHVGHVGIDEKGTLETSDGLDPSWTVLINELQGYGVGEEIVEENLDFVEGFLAGAKSARKTSGFSKGRRDPVSEKPKKIRRQLAPQY